MERYETVKIDLPTFDMKEERNHQILNYYVELHDEYILWHGEWYSERNKNPKESDDGLDLSYNERWEEEYTYFKRKILRSSIVSVEIMWYYRSETYGIGIEANGYPAGVIDMQFKDKEKADEFHKCLDDYIFKPKTQ